MARIDPSTSRFMDAARWMAALAVVLAHACALAVIDESAAPDPGLLLRSIFVIKNLGHIGVVIFFVLSGYLVGGRELLRLLDGQRFDPARYAIQRFSRIYTVLIPALLLTLLLDHAGQAFFNDGALYTSPANGVGSLQYIVAGRDDLATLLGNALMLQTILIEPLGGNGPLWSLANEWWYYAAFALAVIALQEPLPLRIAALLALLLVLAIMPWTMLLLAFIWLIGVAAALLAERWRGLPTIPAALLLLAGLACPLYLMSWWQFLDSLPPQLDQTLRVAIDLVPACAFAVALVSARNLPIPGGSRIHQQLASFSFSLYATHFPALLFLGGVANSVFGLPWARPLDLLCAATVLGMTALACLLAWAFARLTERHTSSVRAAITFLFRRPSSQPT